MSLTKSLNQVITTTIKQYIKIISSKYNLDPAKLLADWQNENKSKEVTSKEVTSKEVTSKEVTSKEVTSKEVTSKEEKNHEPIDPVYILQCKKPELKALCKNRGLPCTGTKAVLIGHLQGKISEKKEKVKVKYVTKNEIVSVKKLKAQIPVIAIRKNKFGRHEHAETGLVFDTKLKKVIGTQKNDGTLNDLSKDDINICNKFKFLYLLPENLDSELTLDDELVEELNEEEDKILKEVEEEEVEEEEVEEVEEEEVEEEEVEEEEVEEEEVEEEEVEEVEEEEVEEDFDDFSDEEIVDDEEY